MDLVSRCHRLAQIARRARTDEEPDMRTDAVLLVDHPDAEFAVAGGLGDDATVDCALLSDRSGGGENGEVVHAARGRKDFSKPPVFIMP